MKRDRCEHCGKCADVCPTEAIRMVGEDITADELLYRFLRDKKFYRKNGGVTFSGGEPTAQPEFLAAAAKLCHENGVSVNIETSGFCPTECLSEILPFVDTFLYDCKADSENHKRLTGVGDERILGNLRFLSEHGAKINLRCPIIPGANLTDSYIDKIAMLADRYEGITAVTLLPYHRTGVGKSLALGREAQQEFSVPDEALMSSIKKRIAVKIRQKIINGAL